MGRSRIDNLHVNDETLASKTTVDRRKGRWRKNGRYALDDSRESENDAIWLTASQNELFLHLVSERMGG